LLSGEDIFMDNIRIFLEEIRALHVDGVLLAAAVLIPFGVSSPKLASFWSSLSIL